MKMSAEEFTNKIDGAINDYQSGVTNGIEFRSTIIDVLMSVFNEMVLDGVYKPMIDEMKAIEVTPHILDNPGRYLMNAMLHDNGMTSNAESEFRTVFPKDEFGQEIIEGNDAEMVEAFANLMFAKYPELLLTDTLDFIATGEEGDVENMYQHYRYFPQLLNALHDWYQNFTFFR